MANSIAEQCVSAMLVYCDLCRDAALKSSAPYIRNRHNTEPHAPTTRPDRRMFDDSAGANRTQRQSSWGCHTAAAATESVPRLVWFGLKTADDWVCLWVAPSPRRILAWDALFAARQQEFSWRHQARWAWSLGAGKALTRVTAVVNLSHNPGADVDWVLPAGFDRWLPPKKALDRCFSGSDGTAPCGG